MSHEGLNYKRYRMDNDPVVIHRFDERFRCRKPKRTKSIRLGCGIRPKGTRFHTSEAYVLGPICEKRPP